MAREPQPVKVEMQVDLSNDLPIYKVWRWWPSEDAPEVEGRESGCLTGKVSMHTEFPEALAMLTKHAARAVERERVPT